MIMISFNMETASYSSFQIDKFMEATDHPNILRLLEIFEDEKNLFLVTELCGAGDLGRCGPLQLCGLDERVFRTSLLSFCN